MSVRELRALMLKARADVESSTAGDMSYVYRVGERWGRYSAYGRATEMVDAIAAQLDALARETDHMGTQAAFRRAARLVRGDDEVPS